jgi:hypothetical protein
MADDEMLDLIYGLLWAIIPLLLFFFGNIYLANRPDGGFFIGYNTFITLLVVVFSIILAVLSAVNVGLADTTDELTEIFTILGVVAPGIIIIIYLCIFANVFMLSKSAPASAPAATKGGGRRHIRSGKSRK